ncbi:methyltransferase domain-containing protein [Longispora sp. NPDC051575]|uniref:class I SAM-dependent methyltransferase n=1 Tax=Longispora sp. NPDC051575 TaxID=3154943 RepID=UPI003448EBDF
MITTEAVDPRRVEALRRNRHTVESYERWAKGYAESVSPEQSPFGAAALRRLAGAAGPGGTVLEVGSGPGWDADFVESLGVAVRRTDATGAFRDIQTARGKQVGHLDLLADDLGGPYDAVLAMCVLIHIDRALTDLVLGKVAGALRPDGAFLVSVREGTGELWDSGEAAGCHLVFWDRAGFAARLASAGFTVDWDDRHVYGGDEPWLTFLARRTR